MPKPHRLYRAAIILAGALIGLSGAVTVATTANASTATGSDCAAAATYGSPRITFRKTDTGLVASATIALGEYSPCAPQDVTLVSYIAPKPEFDVPQYAFEHRSSTLSATAKTTTLEVSVPDCNTQVDLFRGRADQVIDQLVAGGPRYGGRKLVSYNGGTQNCVQPAVQDISKCDGGLDLALSNNGYVAAKETGYAVDFQVTYGGNTRTVSVKSGATETVSVPAGSGTVTVNADRLGAKTFTWARAATCQPAATAANDCTNVTVTVTNPQDNVIVDADVTYNGATKKAPVEAGKSVDVTFTAANATSATVAFPGLSDVQALTIPVRARCARPSPSASTTPKASPSPSASTKPAPAAPAPSTSPVSSNTKLPKTGAAGGVIAGGAVLLLIIGGVLFFLARRRRVNFTA